MFVLEVVVGQCVKVELDKLSGVYPALKEKSFFRTPNLEGALAVTGKTFKCEDKDRQEQLRKAYSRTVKIDHIGSFFFL